MNVKGMSIILYTLSVISRGEAESLFSKSEVRLKSSHCVSSLNVFLC